MSFTAQLLRGIRLTLLLWLLTVVVITLPLLAVARLVAPDAAAGSLLRRDGAVVGARLIGQPFKSARYLRGRPADAANLAASNPELGQRVAQAASRWQRSGVSRPAPDLLQDSGSGVDPHISLAAARQQLPRLARERGLPLAELERLLRQHREGPLGLQAIEPVVNVLGFNLALDALNVRAATSQPAP
ncbi:MAG: potassium-transporting ATPase subunit C [Synechococcaceae cyanobacterium]|jgi:K+-transporting ATPase ATPase C chain